MWLFRTLVGPFSATPVSDKQLRLIGFRFDYMLRPSGGERPACAAASSAASTPARALHPPGGMKTADDDTFPVAGLTPLEAAAGTP